VIEEFAPIEEVRDKVQRIRTLKREVELDNEWVIDESHDVSLSLGVLHLVGLDNEVFLEGLHCVDFPIYLSLDHIDFAEAASAYDFQYGKIVHT
jgi:hypothetical protein